MANLPLAMLEKVIENLTGKNAKRLLKNLVAELQNREECKVVGFRQQNNKSENDQGARGRYIYPLGDRSNRPKPFKINDPD